MPQCKNTPPGDEAGADPSQAIASRDRFAPEVEALLKLWHLTADGVLVSTRSSWVLPVHGLRTSAILKVARVPDERCGYALMRWWNGQGAARVLASADHALLLERATGEGDLTKMAQSGNDDRACRILCESAARLHTSRPGPLPDLHPLQSWFQALFDLAGQHSCLKQAAIAARRLLSDPHGVCALHGDLHHQNVLDFGERGWLAIDPHGLFGERFFDFANIFTNPDLGDPGCSVGTLPGRLEARLAIVVSTSQVEPSRMLQWIVAWTGLSAAWFIGDGDDEGAAIDLTINAIASGLLGA